MKKVIYLSLILGSFSGVFASQVSKQKEPFKFSDLEEGAYTHVHISDVQAMLSKAINQTIIATGIPIIPSNVEMIHNNVTKKMRDHQIKTYVTYRGGLDYAHCHYNRRYSDQYKFQYNTLDEINRLHNDNQIRTLLIPIAGVAGLVVGGLAVHAMGNKITVNTPITASGQSSVHLTPSWSTFALGVLAGAASLAAGVFLKK